MNVISGNNSIIRFSVILDKLNAKRIFLVTGKNSFFACGAKKLIDSLSDKYVVHRFYEFNENPDYESLKVGIANFLKFKPDIIVAIGGGSAIDMAKAINSLINKRGSILAKSITNNELNPPSIPFIAIPTTAGSGAEATHFAVLYIAGIKYSISHHLLIPQYVILDPDLLKSQSEYQKAVSGIDAFSQAIESYWSVSSTEESRLYSIEAIKLLWNHLQTSIYLPDENNLLKVLNGSHLAGKAINITKTTAPHAFSYGITTRFGLPHGHAVALTFPFFITLNLTANTSNCNDSRGPEWVVAKINDIATLINVPVNELAGKISSFIKKIGIETNFTKLNIGFDDFQLATHSVNLQRLLNNPVLFGEDQKNNMYYLLSELNGK